MRVTHGIASHEGAAYRLGDHIGARERSLGTDGFFILGITHQDPITYAYALNSEGEQFPGEPLLL